MTDPLELRDELTDALVRAAAGATEYVTGLHDEPVLAQGAEDVARSLDGDLPEDGDGALVTLAELLELARSAATRSSGPRYFHFVMGGTTPA